MSAFLDSFLPPPSCREIVSVHYEFIDPEIATKRDLSKNGMLQKIEAFRTEVERKKRISPNQQGGLLQKIETFRTEVERKRRERGE